MALYTACFLLNYKENVFYVYFYPVLRGQMLISFSLANYKDKGVSVEMAFVALLFCQWCGIFLYHR